MLVRFDDYLILKISGKNNQTPENPATFAVVGSESGAVKVPFSKREWIETDNILLIVPEWLRNALMEGPVVSMNRVDYNGIPMEVQQYGEILADN